MGRSKQVNSRTQAPARHKSKKEFLLTTRQASPSSKGRPGFNMKPIKALRVKEKRGNVFVCEIILRKSELKAMRRKQMSVTFFMLQCNFK